MWEDLASVRGVVDLSPQEALDSAQNFLVGQGYDVTHRTDTTLTVARQDLGSTTEQHGVLRMVVVAVPQPEGGVQIKVSGNDREGVRERQAEWVEWSEGLPKRQLPPVHEATAPVSEARHQRIDRTKALKSLSGSLNLVKFWAISGLITVASAFALVDLLKSIPRSSEPGTILWLVLLLVMAVFGICVLPFALWHYVQRERFFQWLEANWTSLEKGVMHPEGYIISLDTKLIQYKVVFSAIFVTVSFESRPYAFDLRSAGTAQIAFTFLSVVFGWWFLGLKGAVETVEAIHRNLSNKGVFTLRDLAESSQAGS